MIGEPVEKVNDEEVEFESPHGSNEIFFKIHRQSSHCVGAYLCCVNCDEMTGIDEWNEFNNQSYRNPMVDDNGYYTYEE